MRMVECSAIDDVFPFEALMNRVVNAVDNTSRRSRSIRDARSSHGRETCAEMMTPPSSDATPSRHAEMR